MNKNLTFTSGYDKSKLLTYANLLKYFRKNKEFALHSYNSFVNGNKRVLDEYIIKNIQGIKILEVGCGQRFTTTLLFHSMGYNIIGIDTDFIDPHFSIKGFLRVLKTNGFERFVKTFFRHILFDRVYYRTLQKEFGKLLKINDVDIRVMNVCHLEFPDNYFDYICSNAVFEHINDVEKATSEIARVLKSGGIVDIGIHLFPSLSGGHNLEWAYPNENPSKRVPPWDHLRKNFFPTHVYLNKLRENDYLLIFNKYFSIIDIKSKHEGKKFLTKEILNELTSFSKNELLKRSIRVVMKK